MPVAPPVSPLAAPRGRGFSIRFHVADDVAHGGPLALSLERFGDGAGGRGRQLDRYFLGFNDYDGFILLDRITRVLEPVTDLDLRYGLTNGRHNQFNGHACNLLCKCGCDQLFLFFFVTAVRSGRWTGGCRTKDSFERKASQEYIAELYF